MKEEEKAQLMLFAVKQKSLHFSDEICGTDVLPNANNSNSTFASLVIEFAYSGDFMLKGGGGGGDLLLWLFN